MSLGLVGHGASAIPCHHRLLANLHDLGPCGSTSLVSLDLLLEAALLYVGEVPCSGDVSSPMLSTVGPGSL